jgi:hypothetical protein
MIEFLHVLIRRQTSDLSSDPRWAQVLQLLSALPLHGLLILAILVQSYVIVYLWRDRQTLQAKYDDCLSRH